MSIYLADWTSKYFEKYSRDFSEKYSENILEQGPLAPDTNTYTQKANAQFVCYKSFTPKQARGAAGNIRLSRFLH